MDGKTTALSANPQPPSPCSTQAPTSLSDSEAKLRPASLKAGTAELLACLTLVAPSGMTAEDRDAWVRVARETLKGIPADLLATGCHKARRTCRFASEIVPTIIGEVEGMWEKRKRWAAEDRAVALANRNAPRLTHAEPEYVSAAEVGELIKQLATGKQA